MNYAVILAGGNGSRVGFDVPKQFVEICGKPMIVHCVDAFQKHEEVDCIVLVCIIDYIDRMRSLLTFDKSSSVRSLKRGWWPLLVTVTESEKALSGSVF